MHSYNSTNYLGISALPSLPIQAGLPARMMIRTDRVFQVL